VKVDLKRALKALIVVDLLIASLAGYTWAQSTSYIDEGLKITTGDWAAAPPSPEDVDVEADMKAHPTEISPPEEAATSTAEPTLSQTPDPTSTALEEPTATPSQDLSVVVSSTPNP
jgi:hypothetical protein